MIGWHVGIPCNTQYFVLKLKNVYGVLADAACAERSISNERRSDGDPRSESTAYVYGTTKHIQSTHTCISHMGFCLGPPAVLAISVNGAAQVR
jgi:hypothetical protein